jgi:hypothetical protein
MKARVLLLFLAAVGAWGQATDNTIYVKQFQGVTVGTKVANAMLTCNPNPAIPCILILDPSLATFPSGTMPALCSQCSLVDWRAGAPLINLGGVSVPRLQNVYYPAQCATSSAGSWCGTGTELGAWIAAAQADCLAKTGGAHNCPIQVNGGAYTLTTPVVLSGEPFICSGAGGFVTAPLGNTVLTWGPSTGTMFSISGQGAIMQGCTLQGPGKTSSAIAVSLGGSQAYVYDVMRDVNIGNFGTGILFGPNTYLDTFDNVTVHDCTKWLLVPSSNGTSANGENVFFQGSALSNSGSAFSTTSIDIQAPFEFHFHSTSFDQGGMTLEGPGAQVDLNDTHFENPGGALTAPYITMGAGCNVLSQLMACSVTMNGGIMLEDGPGTAADFIHFNNPSAQNNSFLSIHGGIFQAYTSGALTSIVGSSVALPSCALGSFSGMQVIFGIPVTSGTWCGSSEQNMWGFSVNGVVGYSGTKTAGSCVLTIKGGIITGVTGC